MDKPTGCDMSSIYVDVITELGTFRIFVDDIRAPKTAQYFLEHVDKKLLDSKSVYRIVKERSEGIDLECPIEVVQWGMKPDGLSPINVVPLESTKETSLQHKKWSVSTARFSADELYGGFFVCMRDESALNFGGRRHPDGLGFAVFGNVVSGFEILREIFARAESANFLDNEIRIICVVRVSS